MQGQNRGLPCPVAKKCGGCQLQNMEYPRQLRWKQARAEILLRGLGPVRPIQPMQPPVHYRAKVQAAFGVDRQGRTLCGVYQSSTGHVVPVKECMLEDLQAQALVRQIDKLCRGLRIPPYNPRTGQGVLRHVLVRRGAFTGEMMAVLVTAGPQLPRGRQLCEQLRRQCPQLTTLMHNVNRTFDGLMLGPQETVLFGPGFITEALGGLVFKISPRSFFQVNPAQAQWMFEKALEMAAPAAQDRVLDAYCGAGVLGLLFSRRCGQVLGVESNPAAVQDAWENARLNGVENIRFVQQDAGSLLQQMAARGEKADLVLMDPPRAGSDRRFLQSLCRMGPKRVLYISCNPETLRRDLFLLARQGGYRAVCIQPVDLFPYTHHIETVVLLSREEIDAKNMQTGFSMEGMGCPAPRIAPHAVR